MKLVNGISFYEKRQKHSHTINLGIYVRAGIYYEPMRLQGITHLLEHMYFRRLGSIGQPEIYSTFNTQGTIFRGMTYRDFIQWDIDCIPGKFEKSLLLFLEILNEINCSEEEFELEKNVIKRQIEREQVLSFETYANRCANKGSRNEYSIMGKIDILEKMTLEEVKNWRKRIFRSENIFCVITGNFSDEDRQMVINLLSKMQFGHEVSLKNKEKYPLAFEKRSSKDNIILLGTDDISDVSIIFDIDTEKYCMSEVEQICWHLGMKEFSYLSEILTNVEKITDEVTCKYYDYTKYAQFQLSFSVPERELETSLNVFGKAICDVKRKNVLSRMEGKEYWNHFCENNPRKNNLSIAREAIFNIGAGHKEKRGYFKTVNDLFSGNNMSVVVTTNRNYRERQKLRTVLNTIRSEL